MEMDYSNKLKALNKITCSRLFSLQISLELEEKREALNCYGSTKKRR